VGFGHEAQNETFCPVDQEAIEKTHYPTAQKPNGVERGGAAFQTMWIKLRDQGTSDSQRSPENERAENDSAQIPKQNCA
jgi:hypothetical protein